MHKLESPLVIKMLVDPVRWNIIQSLRMTDLKVQEICDKTGRKMNLISYHLKELREAGLVTSRKSEADGRDVYYSLNIVALRDKYKSAIKSIDERIVT